MLNTGALNPMVNHSHYFTPLAISVFCRPVSWAFINFTLGVLAQPIINTASSAKTIKEGKKGIFIGNIIAIPVVVMAALCGIAAKYIFPDIPSISAPALLTVVPPYVAVFFLISMWAPLMSSGSPFLMGATTLVVKGYIAPLLKIEDDRRLL